MKKICFLLLSVIILSLCFKNIVCAEEDDFQLLYSINQDDTLSVVGYKETSTMTIGGSCGENLTWELDQDGILTINGQGAMDDYYYRTWISGNVAETPWKDYEIKGLVLSEGITHVGNYAFYERSSIKGSLILPDSLKDIGKGAFYGCSGLSGSLEIPDSVTQIGELAFKKCSGFTGNLVLPSKLKRVEWGTFDSGSGFTGKLELPKSLEYIGMYAFCGCSGFTGDLNIPKGVTRICADSFDDCVGLESAHIPSTVLDLGYDEEWGPEEIGWHIFDGCDGLRKVVNDSNEYCRLPWMEGYVWYNQTYGINDVGGIYKGVAIRKEISVSATMGDVNGDGEVNRADRIYLARAIAGWDGYVLPPVEVADFNGDGEVNRADRIYLARAIAGWDGYVLNN